jgi:uncharacterized protein YjiK
MTAISLETRPYEWRASHFSHFLTRRASEHLLILSQDRFIILTVEVSGGDIFISCAKEFSLLRSITLRDYPGLP